MKTKVLILAAVLLAACGGGANNVEAPASGTCSYTYSGALTGTFSSDCVGGIAAYNSTQGIGAVTLPTVSGNTYSVGGGLAITSTGGISNKTYSIADSSVQGALLIASSGPEWIANTASSGTAAQGALTINVTSNSAYATANGVTGYYIHGTADATLLAVPGSGATGTLTVHSVF